MSESNSSVKQFHSLESAIAFISECVETDSTVELFNQTMSSESQEEKFFKEPDYFVKYTFPPLKKQFQVMDFRIRYKGHSFPENGKTFKLGGHDKELGHMHIDFLKRGDNWVIQKIWQCR
ncbi:MAG: hypothetical protein IM542_17060 [Pseudanabaena sp. M165S2SP1A06QC]|nr:hypothetical protein [Pseudanabaena sp. M165S2SP1A06QC]